jgi:hypothetical protein
VLKEQKKFFYRLTKTLHRLIERNRLALPREHLEPMARITAKCYLKLGEWQESLQQQQAIGKKILIFKIALLYWFNVPFTL